MVDTESLINEWVHDPWSTKSTGTIDFRDGRLYSYGIEIARYEENNYKRLFLVSDQTGNNKTSAHCKEAFSAAGTVAAEIDLVIMIEHRISFSSSTEMLLEDLYEILDETITRLRKTRNTASLRVRVRDIVRNLQKCLGIEEFLDLETKSEEVLFKINGLYLLPTYVADIYSLRNLTYHLHNFTKRD
jgi:hypothetical protein